MSKGGGRKGGSTPSAVHKNDRFRGFSDRVLPVLWCGKGSDPLCVL